MLNLSFHRRRPTILFPGPRPRPRSLTVVPASRAERLAALLLILGAFAVVLVVVPFRAFELDRFFLPKEVVLHATALLVALLVIPGRKEWTWSRLESSSCGYLLLTLAVGRVRDQSLARAPGGRDHLVGARALLVRPGTRPRRTHQVPGGRPRRRDRGGSAHGAGTGLRTPRFGPAQPEPCARRHLWQSELRRASGRDRASRPPRRGVHRQEPRRILDHFPRRARQHHAPRPDPLARRLARQRGGGHGVPRTRIPAGRTVAGPVGPPATSRHRLLAVLTGAALALLLPNTLDWRSDSPYLDTLKGIANYQEGSGRGRLLQWKNSVGHDDARSGSRRGPRQLAGAVSAVRGAE